MFIVSVSYLIYACLSTLQLCSSSVCENNATTCLFQFAVFNTSSAADFLWIILPLALHSIGSLLIVIFFMEFIIDQSPHPIKGLMIGLTLGTIVAFGGIGYAICYILSFVPPVPIFGLTAWFYQSFGSIWLHHDRVCHLCVCFQGIQIVQKK